MSFDKVGSVQIVSSGECLSLRAPGELFIITCVSVRENMKHSPYTA